MTVSLASQSEVLPEFISRAWQEVLHLHVQNCHWAGPCMLTAMLESSRLALGHTPSTGMHLLSCFTTQVRPKTATKRPVDLCASCLSQPNFDLFLLDEFLPYGYIE